ncbi:beta-N-acetylhexosaminidase [Homoserinimonas hongtaonis]|uniref:beta-N-acetylhexosaminidase n=1 Tax=Homoserinimonas hongtaonis TaxID=2079791 RepID=UPI000D332D1F|nr:beta-N-acetylhexosaminidase [Salinibacterium hongtaonis]AWB88374.1 beta-N-acetylhexosaminidase [Salinibacterium hongtaonis]
MSACGVIMLGFAGTELPEWVAARLRGGVGGVCLFGDNIESPAQVRALTADIRQANPHAVIAIDEEGGDVTRLYYATGSPYPGNAILGRIDDEAYTASVAESVGHELRSVGVNLTFAPDIDINSNPDNPVIGVRSFGSTPELVARHAAAWVRGLQSTGVAASVKHFPGHGDTAQDSHLALPVVDRSRVELEARELVPFAAAVAAGTASIMTSHILLPQLDADAPATLSPRILQGLLRDEFGFDGLIVSDALDMKGASEQIGIPEAAVRAIIAGCDLLCIGPANTDEQIGEIEAAIDAAVTEGRISPSRMRDAADRVLALARSYPAEAQRGPHDGPQCDLDRTIAAFDVRTGTRPGPTATIVALETPTNIAVGAAPWGLPAHVRVSEGDRLPDVAGQLVVIGRDNHRHGWVRDLIDEARATSSDVVVVDMGWPSDDRAYADVATFGASRHVGDALAKWWAQE